MDECHVGPTSDMGELLNNSNIGLRFYYFLVYHILITKTSDTIQNDHVEKGVKSMWARFITLATK